MASDDLDEFNGLLLPTEANRQKLSYWVRLAEENLRKITNAPGALKDAPPDVMEGLEKWARINRDTAAFALPPSEYFLQEYRCLANAEYKSIPNWRPNIPDLPEELTRPERLAQLLEIVWADVDFWRPMHSDLETCSIAAAIQSHLRTHHVLNIEFPSAVWQEMVRERVKRRYLFSLMIHCAPEYFFLGDPALPKDLSREWQKELNPEALGNLLAGYIFRPSDDNRARLSVKNWSRLALQKLTIAGRKLADDAAWCRANDNRVLAPRAPQPPFQPHKLEKAIMLEKLVRQIHNDRSLLKHPSKLAALELGKPSSNDRAYGSEAIELFKLRECFLDPKFSPGKPFVANRKKAHKRRT